MQREATLHPAKSELAEVEKIILKYLNDKEKQKSSRLSRIGSEFKEFYYALKMKNYAALVLNIDVEINELNYRLRPHRIKFTEFMRDQSVGSMDKDGNITINSNAFDSISKVNGKWDVKELMEVVGHELIHREQFARGMKNTNYSQKAGGAKYWNDPAEVMAWAYSEIKSVIDNNPDAELKDVIHHIKTSPELSQFLNRFSQKNRQKVVKHMIDYAKKEMEK